MQPKPTPPKQPEKILEKEGIDFLSPFVMALGEIFFDGGL